MPTLEDLERTMLVIVDDAAFIQISDKGALLHTSFRHATLFEDDWEQIVNVKRHQRMLPGSTIARVRCTFEEVR